MVANLKPECSWENLILHGMLYNKSKILHISFIHIWLAFLMVVLTVSSELCARRNSSILKAMKMLLLYEHRNVVAIQIAYFW